MIIDYRHEPREGEEKRVTWRDMIGNASVKRNLLQLFLWPAKYPAEFTGLLAPQEGLLPFGPPRNGKTMAAKAVASKCKATFFNVDAASFGSKWFGDSEKMVKALFEVARERAPSIIFMDEVDGIMPASGADLGFGSQALNRIKAELLVQLDGLPTTADRVQVIGATNRPWDIDVALLNRLPIRTYVPLPDQEGRAALFRKLLGTNTRGHTLTDDDFDHVAIKTEGYSYRDLTKLCREAAYVSVREALMTDDVDECLEDESEAVMALRSRRSLQVNKVLTAAQKIKPTTHPQLIARLEDWKNEYAEQT
ncbi:unnamed protein product [Vitrella brassicaformis CCMP3155]|uniref:AAA+ ATPase domain-containing protein n=1 Tax=Vitrella brassicaformis (strain CCMP3155) TaxID=1169540 RepID=A0A0G4F4U9_VITBC|nr:unnamed protein product [Vitrella brassicaformis CCMP3155]|eukprot:CEM06747.1 unnamed protein product [Vitrella brassicaformis CCMP3155]